MGELGDYLEEFVESLREQGLSEDEIQEVLDYTAEEIFEKRRSKKTARRSLRAFLAEVFSRAKASVTGLLRWETIEDFVENCIEMIYPMGQPWYLDEDDWDNE